MSYPTYGRGIDPNPSIDTYMINSSLCQDGIHGSAAKKKVTIKRDANGTQLEDFSDDGEGQKKPKIISPRRQKYEGQFEKFLVQKYVEEAVKK